MSERVRERGREEQGVGIISSTVKYLGLEHLQHIEVDG